QYAFNVEALGASAPLTLFGLLMAPAQAIFGSGTPWFLLTFNAVLWTCAILTLLRPMRPSVRPGAALLLCLAPAFVDGALHGTDAEWLGFLLALSYASVSVGRTAQSIVWYSLAVLSSPATCLFAPVLLSVHGGRLGLGFGLKSLINLRNLCAAVAPIAVWAWIANSYSEHGVAEPLIHWAQNLSSPWTSLGDLWLGLPRYTLLAGSQHYPMAAQHALSVVMFVLLAFTVRENLRAGTASSRGWLCFYFLMVAFGTGVSGSALQPAASVLPAMAFIMSLVPTLLHLVPRFHGTRMLRGSSLVLVTLAMPIGFAAISERRDEAMALNASAATLLTAHSANPDQTVLTSQAGAVGFLYPAPLLQPNQEVGPGQSFASAALRLGPDWVLVPAAALKHNSLQKVGPMWSNEDEHSRWNAAYSPAHEFGGWRIFGRSDR
ncbi:MAG: hypothetical protein P1V35_16555, partial [Planctomycetota bacterium]|nr:hypothetical protein [Planctomycetota bacterium]